MKIFSQSILLICISSIIQLTDVNASDNKNVSRWDMEVMQETENVTRKFKTLVKLFKSSYGKLPESFLNIKPGDARVSILKNGHHFGISFSKNGIMEMVKLPHMTAHASETAGPLLGSAKVLKKVTDAFFENTPKLCETFKDYNRCELIPHNSGLVQIPTDVTFVEYRQLNSNIVIAATYCGRTIGSDMNICEVSYFWKKD